MEYSKEEIFAMVRRWAAETGVIVDGLNQVALYGFARWLMSQKLQQTPCSALRVELAQMLMEEQQKARHLQTTVNRLRTSNNIDALQRVIKLIDERQPVA